MWFFTETQLSEATIPTVRKALQHGAYQQHRQVRVITGAAAPLRRTSTWAGSWTGVLALADFPSREIRIPWHNMAYTTGRVAITAHMVDHAQITVATVYGYAKGPTFPHAHAHTDELLQNLTTHLVLGQTGARIILGDLNATESQLPQLAIWKEQGWIECQALALHRWGAPIRHTCKGATQRDYIYLSPEAAALCLEVSIENHFHEHSTVSIRLQLEEAPRAQQVWKHPATIPWDQVRQAELPHSLRSMQTQPQGDSTTWYRQWGRSFEAAVQEHIAHPLPAKCKGRCQQLAPHVQPPQKPLSKPSRQGEVILYNDFIGWAVARWFSQLRRVQSLKHAIHGCNDSEQAKENITLHWNSILRAKGFAPRFPLWWPTRKIKLLGSPADLQRVQLTPDTVDQIYDDFHQNFRDFEAFHNRSRNQVLKERYDANQHLIYKFLRRPKPSLVDSLLEEKHATILAYDPDTQQVHLDSDMQLTQPETLGQVDGIPATITNQSHDLAQIHMETTPLPGQALTLNCFITKEEELHRQFHDEWSQRWNKHAQVPEEQWARILNFGYHFLPKGEYLIPQIQPEDWRQTAQALRPTAARGPDGLARDDLLNIPSRLLENLIGMFHSIEEGAADWPAQLLQGTVLATAKKAESLQVLDFRPIVIYGAPYRIWSSLRAKACLKHLAHQCDFNMYGFLPGREASQYWYEQQAWVELSLQGQSSLGGWCSDIQKCFNALPRLPLLQLALHLGIPAGIVRAWANFLNHSSRRFQIRGGLGDAILATTGLPEGCALSTVAMCILDMSYHLYFKAFLPTVQTYSYVDNLAVQVYTAGELLRAWIAYLAFCDMWQIEPDTEKSLAWSLDPRMTQQAQLIGPHVVTEMKDLGGHMTFKIKQTSRPTTTKTQSIDWEWERLRRAPAPYNQKINALFIKFWPAIFYGTSISQVTDKAVHQLRTQATKALQAQRAGSNALLRLCLCPNMLADPGFFRLQMVIRELRRMCRKLPALVGLWRAFHRRFDGTLLAGPFSQVLTCLNQIGWLLLEPPLIKDHNGCVHDLLDIDHKLLRLQLQEAWAQHVAKQVQHRKTMSDLEGLDLHLSNPDTGRLTALQLARVRALQDGSFRLATQHAKYDATNTGQCRSCGVPETVKHLCLHCPALQSHRRDHEWLTQHWPDLPRCLTHHLLVPRLRGHADYIQALHNTPDVSDRFEEFEMQHQTYNLFTDGSCVPHANPALSLASWAVYCVEEDLTIAAGPLQGIAQTIQRAELVGILSAVTWAARTTRTVRIWTDCQMCIDGWAHEDNHKRHHGLANMDLWRRIWAQRQQCNIMPTVHKVQSHQAEHQRATAVQDWEHQGNSAADTAAKAMLYGREPRLLALRAELLQQQERYGRALRAIRELTLARADFVAPPENTVEAIEFIPPTMAFEDRPLSLAAQTGPHGQEAFRAGYQGPLPLRFVRDVCQWLVAFDGESGGDTPISWFELAIAFQCMGGQFPVRHPKGWVSLDTAGVHTGAPSIGDLIFCMREVVRKFFSWMDCESLFVRSIDCSAFGITCFSAGVRIGVCTQTILEARRLIFEMAQRRPFRSAADFARPC